MWHLSLFPYGCAVYPVQLVNPYLSLTLFFIGFQIIRQKQPREPSPFRWRTPMMTVHDWLLHLTPCAWRIRWSTPQPWTTTSSPIRRHLSSLWLSKGEARGSGQWSILTVRPCGEAELNHWNKHERYRNKFHNRHWFFRSFFHFIRFTLYTFIAKAHLHCRCYTLGFRIQKHLASGVFAHRTTALLHI